MKESARGCAISYLLYLAETFWLMILTLIQFSWWIILALILGFVISFLVGI